MMLSIILCSVLYDNTSTSTVYIVGVVGILIYVR